MFRSLPLQLHLASIPPHSTTQILPCSLLVIIELSSRMLRSSRESLNVISHNSAIGLVQSALNKGINVAELYVDTVGDAEVYRSKLQNIFPKTKVTVTSKADALFPIVSAASICAKVCICHLRNHTWRPAPPIYKL